MYSYMPFLACDGIESLFCLVVTIVIVIVIVNLYSASSGEAPQPSIESLILAGLGTSVLAGQSHSVNLNSFS